MPLSSKPCKTCHRHFLISDNYKQSLYCDRNPICYKLRCAAFNEKICIKCNCGFKPNNYFKNNPYCKHIDCLDSREKYQIEHDITYIPKYICLGCFRISDPVLNDEFDYILEKHDIIIDLYCSRNNCVKRMHSITNMISPIKLNSNNDGWIKYDL